MGGLAKFSPDGGTPQSPPGKNPGFKNIIFAYIDFNKGIFIQTSLLQHLVAETWTIPCITKTMKNIEDL